MARRPKGTGTIYRQARSSFWWIGYPQNGRYVRESSGSTKKWEAEQLLRRRLAEAEMGYLPQPRRVLVRDLADALLVEYRLNRKSAAWAELVWRVHLQPRFGDMRASALTTDALNQYIELRQVEGAANGTINRELAILKRMFNLAPRSTPPRVPHVPLFPKLKEPPARSGFINPADYEHLRDSCHELWLRAMIALAYTFGFRQSELLSMRVRQVDLTTRTIRLEPGTTKNDEGRMVHMTSEVEKLLAACISGKGSGDYVFTRMSGHPVRDFRKSWATACVRAGLGQTLCRTCSVSVTTARCRDCYKARRPSDVEYKGLLFHDLRRSAVRNMVRRGIPERVAMAISGHKTRSVFDRYNIVSDTDLIEAAGKLEGSFVHA